MVQTTKKKNFIEDARNLFSQITSNAKNNLQAWGQVASNPQLRQDYTQQVVKPILQKQYNPQSYVQPIKSFGKGFGNMSTMGLVSAFDQENPDINYRVGQVAGLVNPLNPVNKAMGALNIGGRVVGRFAPQATGFLAKKIIPGLVSEGVQTLGYTGAQIGSQVAGLSPKTPITGEDFLTNMAMGSVLRGPLSIFGKPAVKNFKMDKTLMAGLETAEDMIRNPAKYLDPKTIGGMTTAAKNLYKKRALKEIQLQAAIKVQQYAAKYLPTVDIEKLANDPLKLVKRITDLNYSNKLAYDPNFEGPQMGIVGKPQTGGVSEGGLKYLYHGTSETALDNIAKEGLKPGRHTGNISLSSNESYAQNWAKGGITPQGKTKGVMLRINQDLLKNKILPSKSGVKSDQLNELISKEVIPPESLEIYKNGKWQPLVETGGVGGGGKSKEFQPIVDETLSKLRGQGDVATIKGIGSNFTGTKIKPNDVDMLVELNKPFEKSNTKELSDLLESIKDKYKNNEGDTLLNVFIKDSNGKVLNSVDLWFHHYKGESFPFTERMGEAERFLGKWEKAPILSQSQGGGGMGGAKVELPKVEFPQKGTIEQPNVPAGMKQRGFVTSVKEAPQVNPNVKAQTESLYKPKPDDQLMGEAQALLQDGASIDFKNVKNLDQKVTATIKKALSEQGTPEGDQIAANLYNNLSEQGTEIARGLRAFSMLDKMSPEAISLSVAGKIKKYNINAGKKIPELTGEQTKLITDQVNAIDLLKGREKQIALNELQNTLNDFIPSSLVDKFITVWKAGLLTSLRTHARNFVGNTIHGVAEIAKDVPATAADIAMSLRTGKRTITTTLKGVGEFGSKSTRQQMKDILLKGYDPSETINKFDYRRITWGKNILEQGLKKYTDIVYRTLGASDKPYYNAALARSLYSQAGAEAINVGQRGSKVFIENLVKAPTEEMMKIAINDANIAVFKNKNMATSVAGAIKKELSKSELGKLVGEVTMPFTGVPSSIFGQIGAYSPVGLIRGVLNSGKVVVKNVPELQRKAAQEIGRGVIGTGIFGLGAYLMSKGLITGQPKDADEARVWDLENKPRNSIMLFGKWRSLNSIGPEAVVFLAGAKMNEELGKPEGSMATYGLSVGKDFLDQSFVTGLQAPVNALADPARYGKSYAGQLISSPIPNIVKDFSKSQDKYARETNTVLDYAKVGTPFRQSMTPKRDVLGNVMLQEPTGIGAFIDLFNSKTPVNNAVVSELSRLYDAGNSATPSKLSASQTIMKTKVKLSPEQLNAFEAMAGRTTQDMLAQLIKSPNYQAATDEEKAKAIDNIVSKVRDQAKQVVPLNSTNMSEQTISKEFSKAKTPQQKQAMWDHLVKIGIINKDNYQQVSQIMKGGD